MNATTADEQDLAQLQKRNGKSSRARWERDRAAAFPIAERLRAHPILRVGMTRREAMELVREQGGMFSDMQQAFLHYAGKHVQISLEFSLFDPAERLRYFGNARTAWETSDGRQFFFDERDTVVRVGEPFVQYRAMD